MSKNISNVSFRIDSKLKNEATELFESMGLTLTAAFNIFLRQAVREKGMPFAVTTVVPNKETVKAIKETKEAGEKARLAEAKLEEAKKEAEEYAER